MNKKYRVQLSEAERKEVQETLVAKGIPPSIRKRCSVLLMADESIGKVPTQEEVAQRCGVCGVTVYQLVKGYTTQGLSYCLRRQKHETPPRTPIVTGEKEARIIALACSTPPQGRARWTVRLLRDKVVELQIVDSIGRETIRTTLKKRNYSPS
jgi:transposase